MRTIGLRYASYIHYKNNTKSAIMDNNDSHVASNMWDESECVEIDTFAVTYMEKMR